MLLARIFFPSENYNVFKPKFVQVITLCKDIFRLNWENTSFFTVPLT